MLKLIVGEENGTVQSATVPVRWCVDKDTIEMLKQRSVKNPHVLIVVAHQNFENNHYCYRETSRQIAPLEQLMDYVQFLKPGKNTIVATIVWGDSEKPHDLWKKYLCKENGKYWTKLIYPYTQNRMAIFILPSDSLEEAEIDVEVPKELFAKEYPKWLQKWVNLWYETKPKDQCHFRRRMIPAFTIQPLMVLLWLVSKTLLGSVIALALLLSGIRKVGFKAIIHPWKRDFEDVWVFTEDSIFSRKWKDEKGGEHQIWFLLPLAPIFYVALFLIMYGLNVLGILKQLEPLKLYTNLEFLFYAGTMVIFVVVCAGMWDLITYDFVQLRILLKPLIKSLLASSEKVKVEIPEIPMIEPPKPISVISPDSEQFLLCNGNFSTNIRDLPPKRRTVYLRFQDLKAKVCKPLPQ